MICFSNVIQASGSVREEYCTYYSVIQICLTHYTMIHYSSNYKWVSVTDYHLDTAGTVPLSPLGYMGSTAFLYFYSK